MSTYRIYKYIFFYLFRIKAGSGAGSFFSGEPDPRKKCWILIPPKFNTKNSAVNPYTIHDQIEATCNAKRPYILRISKFVKRKTVMQ